MPANITDVSAFTSPIVVPVDGDPRNAASVGTAIQGLANRTRFLDDKIDTLAISGFRLRGAPTRITTGSGTYIPDSVVRAVRILAVGGGGGGGGAQGGGAPAVAAGGGGTSGSAVEAFVRRADTTSTYEFPYTIGVGGAGGEGITIGTGDDGGETTVELLAVVDFRARAFGGSGGRAMGSGTTARRTLDGTRGSAPTVTGVFPVVSSAILIRQNASGPGFCIDTLAVASGGAPSVLGGGYTSQLGTNADSPGAGGSGARATTSSVDGGAGAAGVIIIWEYV